MANTMVGSICNYFDFGGGGFTVDGACSSSLLAVTHACQALLNDDMEVVIAGGVDVSLDTFEILGFAKLGAFARDDIRPYDKHAEGLLPGEGCGMVVLTKLSHAKKMAYPIYAVIKGCGYSSDGRGGITAPEVQGQKRALDMAYAKAGYPISTVSMIEGHGTGTILGDRIELTAISEAIKAQGNTPKGSTWFGSIKGNIGHCKAAAGMAGFIKAVMALKYKIMPASGNCNHPTGVFEEISSPLQPLIHGRLWEKNGKTPRRAAVSALGFGGSNTHITLEEISSKTSYDEESKKLMASSQASELILISDKSVENLLLQFKKLLKISKQMSIADLTDLSAALAQQKPKGDYRVAIICRYPSARELFQRDHGMDERLVAGIPRARGFTTFVNSGGL